MLCLVSIIQIFIFTDVIKYIREDALHFFMSSRVKFSSKLGRHVKRFIGNAARQLGRGLGGVQGWFQLSD